MLWATGIDYDYDHDYEALASGISRIPICRILGIGYRPTGHYYDLCLNPQRLVILQINNSRYQSGVNLAVA